MPKKDEIIEKLDYLGLDLTKIPKSLKTNYELEYRVPKFYDDNQYKQYRYINVKDIQILLTPLNRLDDLEEKYRKSAPLSDFLDSKHEENFIKHTTFLNMLKNVKIEKIEEIEKEQEKLSKNIPFKVKFTSNYLWQIYYSKNTDKYFMLVPTEDAEYEAFFYLLKKKIENKKNAKIFVPICGVEYSNEYLKKAEFQDVQNYMWLFTKEWPLVYEVYDKNDDLSIEIVGETYVFERIKSYYRIKLEDKEQATSFYKLIKAMFILQTELSNYFEFKTNINKDGGIDFYQEGKKIEYKDIPAWLKEEYIICNDKIKQTIEQIELNTEKLNKLKAESVVLDMEYIEKEKQISTFLECKKSFFGKFKYYFKYSKTKKKKIKDIKKKEDVEDQEEQLIEQQEDVIPEIKDNYTIEELIENYKKLEEKETNLKNILMDINALKLKNKNLTKKIENASVFIREIDSHKKSIFEFWKYSNKDEMAALPEGEAEEINVVKKIKKTFDYEDDLEDFGIKYDKLLRKVLTQEETDAVYITTTNVIDILNKIKNNELLPKDIDNSLKQIKKEAIEEKTLFENEEFDIFGGSSDTTKVGKIKNNKHRELAKDKYRILEISKTTKPIGYKLTLEQILNKIKLALENSQMEEELSIYKLLPEKEINKNNINIFNLNPVDEVDNNASKIDKNQYLYKVNLSGKINAVPLTNIIFYDNQNKTLPIGMDLSTQILVDVNKLKLAKKDSFDFNYITFENEQDDFSNIRINKVNVIEFE